MDIAESLSKSPQQAFLLKNEIEELKFWAELGAAEAVIAKLESMPESEIFSKEFTDRLIFQIKSFLNDEDTMS